MKEWIKENLLKSRTFWAAILALFICVGSWLAFIPKTLESWVALGSSVILITGIWTGVNKIGDNIKTNGGGK